MTFLDSHKKDIDCLFKIVQEHVKNKFDIVVLDIDELKVKSRKKHLVYFRRLMMVVLGETFNNKEYNQEQFSNIFDLDRTSFIHHYKIHINEYSRYPEYKNYYNQIRDEFLLNVKTL